MLSLFSWWIWQAFSYMQTAVDRLFLTSRFWKATQAGYVIVYAWHPVVSGVPFHHMLLSLQISGFFLCCDETETVIPYSSGRSFTAHVSQCWRREKKKCHSPHLLCYSCPKCYCKAACFAPFSPGCSVPWLPCPHHGVCAFGAHQLAAVA